MTTVSVGITSKDEEATIVDAIRSSAAQQGAGELEIIVVAAGSDRTIPLAQEVARSDPRVRVLVEEEPRGKPRAINRILEAARGEIVVLTDGDVVLVPGALAAIVAALRGPDVGAATGRPISTSTSTTFMDHVAQTSYELFHRIRLWEMARAGSVSQASGYLLAVRRELLRRVPEGSGLTDDAAISAIIRQQGHRIVYSPEAVVRVHFPATVKDFLVQKRRTRRGLPTDRLRGDSLGRRTPWWELTHALRNGQGLAGRRARDLLFGVGFWMLTALSWGLAYWDRLMGRVGDDTWRAVPSTKRAFDPR